MRSTLTVALACVCALVLTGCPVDDRALGPHAGLEFIETGGDSGAGGSSDGAAGGGELGGSSVQPTSGQGGQLEPGAGGQAGSVVASGGTAGLGAGGAGASAGGAGSGGIGASQGGAGAFTGACPDLDGNGVPDCQETMITDASFPTGVAGWLPEPSVSLEWASADAGGASDSGSLGVSDTIETAQEGSRMTGATQCQVVNSATIYRFDVEVSVPDEAPDTSGGFQIILFDGPKCTGTTLDTRTSMLSHGSAWQLADIEYLTPAGAKSVSVRLVTVKPFADSPVTVLFDDVLMHAE